MSIILLVKLEKIMIVKNYFQITQMDLILWKVGELHQ